MRTQLLSFLLLPLFACTANPESLMEEGSYAREAPHDTEAEPWLHFDTYVYYADEKGAFFFDETYERLFPEQCLVDCGGGGGGGGGPPPSAAACWQFAFAPVGGPFFPNPYNNYTGILKADLNLLVLGTDYQFYTATVSYVVYNSIGQLISSGTVGTYSPSPNFRVNIWNGTNGAGSPVASGTYNVRATATSGLCGTKSFSSNVIVVH